MTGARQSRRTEILEAAAEVFVERGFDATTTRDIGERAGLLSGSLYHHFDTKEQMLHELVHDVYTPTAGYMAEARERAEDAAATLFHLVRVHVGHLLRSRHQAFLFLHESRSLTPEHRATIKEEEERYVGAIDDLVAEGQAEGSLRDDIDPVLARLVVLGAANWVYRWFRDDGDWSPDHVAETIAKVTVDGLRTDAVQRGTTTPRSARS